jgi:two-component system nitrogen regulation sensor histidine kinase GlnL
MSNQISDEFPLAILEESKTAFLILRESFKPIYANNACQQLLRQSAYRLCQQTLQQLAVYYHFDPSSALSAFHNKTSYTDNELTLSIEGQNIVVELSATFMRCGKLEYLIIEICNLDHLHKVNQLHQQESQQKVAQKLVRGLAHEIKNPLGGLRGAAQLLEAELADPDLKEFTQLIIEQADRLSSLVDRLLGPNQLGIKTQINIHSILEKVHHLIAITLPSNIRLKTDYDPSLPEILAQDDQLEQVFLNIIQNAVQVIQETSIIKGEITLKTRTAYNILIGKKYHKLAAEIKIIDNGPGIPEKLQNTLFYPMVTGRPNGTGLGLSIAQELIKQHHGRIEYHRNAGYTEFLIYLPFTKRERNKDMQ